MSGRLQVVSVKLHIFTVLCLRIAIVAVISSISCGISLPPLEDSWNLAEGIQNLPGHRVKEPCLVQSWVPRRWQGHAEPLVHPTAPSLQEAWAGTGCTRAFQCNFYECTSLTFITFHYWRIALPGTLVAVVFIKLQCFCALRKSAATHLLKPRSCGWM